MFSAISKRLKAILLTLLSVVVVGCAMNGRREVVVPDEDGTQLHEVLVIPLYLNSFDVNIGIEGKPLAKSYNREVVITKLFLFNSGEDIIAKQIPSRGVIVPIPPIAYSGSDHTIIRYLIVKSGYQPIVLSHHDVASKRWKAMTRTAENPLPSIIQLLLSSTPDQAGLKNMMNATDLKDSIQVRLSPEDVALLRSYQRGY